MISLADALPASLARNVIERQVLDHCVRLEVVADMDPLLGHYAQHCGSQLDMMPYYAMLWPSAEAMVAFLTEHYSALEGTRVLELGCGLAFPSIVSALLGAEVDAMDFHPDCLGFVHRNAELNGGVHLQTRCANWSDPMAGDYDLILGSDLLYEAHSVDSLARCLGQFRDRDVAILLSDPGREHFQAAVNQICQQGFVQKTHVVHDCFVVEFRPVAASKATVDAAR